MKVILDLVPESLMPAQVECMGVPSGSLLWLGLPTTVSHTIDASSPLQGFMPNDMAALDMEVLVLLDGIDASTSGHVQAR